MEISRLLYYCSSVLLLTVTALPLIKHTSWVIRVFDYPRMQKFFLLLVVLASGLWLVEPVSRYDYVLLTLNVGALFYLGALIYPYTAFSPKMVKKEEPRAGEKPLSLLVANVYQENRSYESMISLIKKRNADILFLLETDTGWQSHIRPAVEADYPHAIEVPLGNTYGLLFYSKLPLEYQQVNYLIDPEIPSIIADIRYNHQLVRLYGLHPTPPVPQENPESTERDAEILLIGRMAEKHPHPSIVFGDLNDVAWSRTTRLFLKTSGMLDPRRGRGMYNTFHVKYRFLRWPLDHFFISPHFRITNIRVEKTIESDHFPISLSVVLRNEDESGQLEPDASEVREVDEKIREGIASGKD